MKEVQIYKMSKIKERLTGRIAATNLAAFTMNQRTEYTCGMFGEENKT